MRRHVKTIHGDFKDDDTIDDSESQSTLEEEEGDNGGDDTSLQDNSDKEEMEEEEEEDEEAEEDSKADSWRLLIEEVFKRCQSEFNERVAKYMLEKGIEQEAARKKVYDIMLPTYRKVLANVFVNEILWFEAMKKDRTYLTVKKTVSDLKLYDDFDNEEAWKSAVSKRKFLFDRILKEYDPPKLSDTRDYAGKPDKQEQTAEINNGQEGRGSNKLNINLVSPSEAIALRAKEELLREGRKRGFDGFTPEGTALIESMKKQRSRTPWTIIQNV